SILTISKSNDFANSGGMVEIDLYNRRFPFYINRGAAARVGIRFRPELLRLARIFEANAFLEND
ncbi:MAG: YfiR family protein, partial [bacterium]